MKPPSARCCGPNVPEARCPKDNQINYEPNPILMKPSLRGSARPKKIIMNGRNSRKSPTNYPFPSFFSEQRPRVVSLVQ